MKHVPVLEESVQKYLDLKDSEVVVDATLGLGGHAYMILKLIGKRGKLVAFEQDERNLAEAREKLKNFEKQIIYIHDNFRYLKNRITGSQIYSVDKIFFDLGMSSVHVDQGDRGFSFMREGPLDMRYDQRNELTAEEVVNTYREEDLERIFFEYGEERLGKKVARKICERRRDKKFSTTTELAEFVSGIISNKIEGKGKIHLATKIFQAIRIEVNDELNSLKEALKQSVELLKVNGRIVVISYHSLEDRIVKKFFKELINPPVKSQEESLYKNFGDPFIKALTKKPVVPDSKEIQDNPRSRSAKLRAYEKIAEII